MPLDVIGAGMGRTGTTSLKVALEQLGFSRATTCRVPGKQDRSLQLAWYKAHNDKVRRRVSPNRLLIYQVSEGWEPLCIFLGVPVPKTSFPRFNNTQDFLTMIRGGPAPVQPTGPKL